MAFSFDRFKLGRRDGREAEGTRLLSGYPGKNRDRGFESLSLRHKFFPKKAVIPAAGKGTRLYPLTKDLPKELLPVRGRPMIFYSLFEVCQLGVEEIIVIISPEKEGLKRYIQEEFPKELGEKIPFFPRITFVTQPRPYGSGEALFRARPYINEEPFLWVMPDFVLFDEEPPCLQLLKACPLEKGLNLVGVLKIKPEEAHSFGNVGLLRGKNLGERRILIEELSGKTKDPIASSKDFLKAIGRWVLWDDIFPLLEATKNFMEEWDDTPALQALCKKGKVIGLLLKGKGFDVGNLQGFLAANAYNPSNRPLEDSP